MPAGVKRIPSTGRGLHARVWALCGRLGPVIVVVARPAQAGTAVSVRARRAADPGGPAAHAVLGTERAVRWAWADTAAWYPGLLADGVRVDRCLDLRLTHRILRAAVPGSSLATAPHGPFDDAGPGPSAEQPDVRPATLFDESPDLLAPGGQQVGAEPSAHRPTADECVAEVAAQDAAVAQAAEPARLRLLLAGESAGALAAAEMNHAGLPWDAAVHDAVLTEALGPRPSRAERPAVLAALAAEIRSALDSPTLNPDSLPHVLRALRRAGLPATSTRSWELQQLDHPAVAPLLAYKKLSRLHSANGWAWLDTWVRDGRFRPEYVVGGVVTGRWSSVGSGALQLPRGLREAVRADEGWRLVVADAAQLEPRVLAGMARDARMTEAGAGRDLYQGMVDAGVVADRDHAKVGMLGALYGGTTGASAAVLPRLLQAYPDATGLVDAAARAGERGERVRTLLGQTSPTPGESWTRTQADALDPDAGDFEASRARSQARSWGRFTRNFVVQGTAAEWALCWIAELRRRLWELGADEARPGSAAGPFAGRPHLVYFLHDELVVHTPEPLAEHVAQLVAEAAATAGRLLFGDYPVEFPVSVGVASSYADAKDLSAPPWQAAPWKSAPWSAPRS